MLKHAENNRILVWYGYSDTYMAGLWYVFFSDGHFDGGNTRDKICHVILSLNWYDLAFPSDKTVFKMLSLT